MYIITLIEYKDIFIIYIMPFASRRRNQLKRTPPPPRQPVQHNQTVERPSFGSTLMQGMAFGTGSSIGHGIVEKVLHPSGQIGQVPVEKPAQNDFCIKTKELYETCLMKNYSDCSELNELVSKFCK